jgi:hypothetical protein
MIVDAPWYVPNTIIQRDPQTATVEEEICCYSSQYSARLSTHPDDLIVNLMAQLDNNKVIPKTLANTSAYQIPSVIIVFVVQVFKVWFVSLISKSHKEP